MELVPSKTQVRESTDPDERINLNVPGEARLWAERLGVREALIWVAVARVGTQAKRVAAELGRPLPSPGSSDGPPIRQQ